MDFKKLLTDLTNSKEKKVIAIAVAAAIVILIIGMLFYFSGIGAADKGNDEDIIIDIPTWNRKSFVGWYEDEDLTIAHSYAKMPNKHYTLYAKWETKNYQIIYELNGGKLENKIEEYTIEDEFILPTPVKENSTFIGWSKGNENIIEKGGTAPLNPCKLLKKLEQNFSCASHLSCF